MFLFLHLKVCDKFSDKTWMLNFIALPIRVSLDCRFFLFLCYTCVHVFKWTDFDWIGTSRLLFTANPTIISHSQDTQKAYKKSFIYDKEPNDSFIWSLVLQDIAFTSSSFDSTVVQPLEENVWRKEPAYTQYTLHVSE